jgi:hypothetical protein
MIQVIESKNILIFEKYFRIKFENIRMIIMIFHMSVRKVMSHFIQYSFSNINHFRPMTRSIKNTL